MIPCYLSTHDSHLPRWKGERTTQPGEASPDGRLPFEALLPAMAFGIVSEWAGDIPGATSSSQYPEERHLPTA